MRTGFLFCVYYIAIAMGACPSWAAPTLLLRQPDVSGSQIVFTYGGDVWISDVEGRNPRRVTSGPADDFGPVLSPDGKSIAFTRMADPRRGRADAFVVATEGGEVRRLTWHPDYDVVLGWTREGTDVLIASRREANAIVPMQMFRVPLTGGTPVRVSAAPVVDAEWSPDGKTLAYVPFFPAHTVLYAGPHGWRRHRGGTTPQIHLLDTQKQVSTPVAPVERTTSFRPFWAGGVLHFVSDREGTFNIYRGNPGDDAAERITNESEWDVLWANGDDRHIVYEVGGRLRKIDLKTGKNTILPITLHLEPFEKVDQARIATADIEEMAMALDGGIATFEARGEILKIVPGETGYANLTKTRARRESQPVISPDSAHVAYVSTGPDGQQLFSMQLSSGQARRIVRLPNDVDSRLLGWSGNGKWLFVEDSTPVLRAIEVATGKGHVVAHNMFDEPFEIAASADGRWVATTRIEPNLNESLVLHDLERRRTYVLSDPRIDVGSPAFDPDGTRLYLTASTGSSSVLSDLELSDRERQFQRTLVSFDLTGDIDGAVRSAEGGSENSFTREAVLERLQSLTVAPGRYDQMISTSGKQLLAIERAQKPYGQDGGPGTLRLINLKTGASEALTENVTAYQLTDDGKAVLFRAGRTWQKMLLPGDRTAAPLKIPDIVLDIDKRAEWQQIFDETWRLEAAYLFDQAMVGVDWPKKREKYAPFLDHVRRREDLNFVLAQMIGEIGVSHNSVSGGKINIEPASSAGLLGIDVDASGGTVRIGRILLSDPWNDADGQRFRKGDPRIQPGWHILSVDGVPLNEHTNLFQLLDGKADKIVTLKVTETPESEAISVSFKTLESEADSRLFDWVEHNRMEVDRLSGGRIGYVYLPSTGTRGIEYFRSMFHAQYGKEALLIDVRANGGGAVPNLVLNTLSAPRISSFVERDGSRFNLNIRAHYGPKAMLADHATSSGGDYLAYGFRSLGLGTLIGERTWGGLVGTRRSLRLVDGGRLSVPTFRFVDADGGLTVENEGVEPTERVPLDHVMLDQGADNQLRSGVEDLMRHLVPAARP